MIQPKYILAPLTALVFGACATTTKPVVDHTHPASAEAAESPARPLPRLLGMDGPTQRTRDLLATRAAEAKSAEEEKPTDETNIAPSTKKSGSHEHHQ